MSKSQGAFSRVISALLIICAASALVIAVGIYGNRTGLWSQDPLGFFSHKASALIVSKTTKYAKCGCTIQESQESIDDSMRQTYINSQSSEWDLEKEASNRLEFVRVVDGYCPTHENIRLITISYGYVCVYRGKQPDSRFLHQRFTTLKESALRPQDRATLRDGLIIEPKDGQPVDVVVAKYLEDVLD